MKELFHYLNYREYLRDYCAGEKARNPAFSFQFLANRAGFKSKSFMYHVIEGKKNLSKDSIFKIATALKFDEKSHAYFEDLVGFTQATALEQRNFYYNNLARYSRRNTAKILQAAQYEFYSQWYHNTVRELVTIVEFNDDYSKLASQIRPAITPRQARQSVQLLLTLGLIKEAGKKYVQTDAAISTGDEVRDLAIQNFHIKNLAMTAGMVSQCPPEERDISAMVVGLSEEGFHSVKRALQLFRKQVAAIAQNDTPAQKVFHISFQCVPTSVSGAKK